MYIHVFYFMNFLEGSFFNLNSDIQNVDKELEKLSKQNDKLQETLDKELEEKATGKKTGLFVPYWLDVGCII